MSGRLEREWRWSFLPHWSRTGMRGKMWAFEGSCASTRGRWTASIAATTKRATCDDATGRHGLPATSGIDFWVIHRFRHRMMEMQEVRRQREVTIQTERK